VAVVVSCYSLWATCLKPTEELGTTNMLESRCESSVRGIVF
jgi:hypothetical protein